MANVFHVDILSPEKTIYSADVLSLVAPAKFGYIGILADHAPLIASLVKGKITARDSSGVNKVFDVKGMGFLEILKNKVTIVLK